MKYSIVPNDQLRELCIKNKWFTCGSNAQYEKLFEGNMNGFTISQLAAIIWLCSENAEMCLITRELLNYRDQYVTLMCTVPEDQREKFNKAIKSASSVEERVAVCVQFCPDGRYYAEYMARKADHFFSFKNKKAYLAAIENAETMADLVSLLPKFAVDEVLTYEDFIDCLNAFKLKRSELKGETK